MELPTTITLAELEQLFDPNRQGPLWSHSGDQLDVNLLHFSSGEGVEAHVNDVLDVWLVVIRGTGEAWVDGTRYDLIPGTCLYLPAGCERAIRSTADPLIYASAHQKRPGLMPR